MTFTEIKKMFEQYCKDNDVCPHCAEVEIEVSQWTHKIEITGTDPVRITTYYED